VSRNLPMLERALKQEPDDPLLRDRCFKTFGVRATHEQKAGRLADAAASWEKAVAFSPEAARVSNLLELSNLWLNVGDHAKALAVADSLPADIAKAPEAQHWRRLAGCYDRAAEVAGKDGKLTPQ
jgi:tetratricopeptide (TPR) repeat protein